MGISGKKTSHFRGKTSKNVVLESVLNVLEQMDEAMQKAVTLDSLHLDCKIRCHYCCFNQPMVTPPEALLIGHQVKHGLTDSEKVQVLVRTRNVLAITKSMNLEEILIRRHELPCIFLTDGVCLVYDLRPAICRAVSSRDATHCKMIFEARDFRARLLCHQQIRTILHTVHKELIARCNEMGGQADFLLMAEAIRDYFDHSRPVEAWMQGERVFRLRES